MFILEILFELLIYVGAEFLFEETSRRGKRRDRTPLGLGLIFFICGGTAGGLSLLAFPELLITSDLGRWLNLLLTPVVCGLAMMAIGKWHQGRGDQPVPIDRFVYAYVFALAMAVVRVGFA